MTYECVVSGPITKRPPVSTKYAASLGAAACAHTQPVGKESPVAVSERHHGRAKLESETRRKVRIDLKAQKHSRFCT